MTRKMLLLAAAAAFQCIALGWLIFRYEQVVDKGVEVRFSCRVVDPHDPFRGRYLNLSVREKAAHIDECIVNRFKEDYEFCHSRNDVFVRVEPATNGLWCVAEASLTPKSQGVWVKPERVIIDYSLPYSARLKEEDYNAFIERRKMSSVQLQVDFPSRLFMNEKAAPAAEKIAAKTKSPGVAIYRAYKGEIVITDVEIDGESITDLAVKAAATR